MKSALKYCSIAFLLLTVVFAIIFYFFFLKNFSAITFYPDLVEGAKAYGWKKFLNGVYYPTGFMIVFLLVLFTGIVSSLFLFGDESNISITSITTGAYLLFEVWFILMFAVGAKYFKRKIYGFDRINPNTGAKMHSKGAKELKAVYLEDFEEEKAEVSTTFGSTMLEHFMNDSKDIEAYDAARNVDASLRTKAQEKAYNDFNSTYGGEGILTAYYSFKSAKEDYDGAASDLARYEKNNKRRPVMFLIASLITVPGPAFLLVYTITDKGEE